MEKKLRLKVEDKVKRKEGYIELYTDFLISQNQYATAMGLSAITDRKVSHDQITRFLNNNEFGSKQKEFIAGVKSNRLFAESLADKYQGKFVSIDSLLSSDKESVRGYLKGYDKELIVICRVFTNKDGSTAKLYRASSDLTLDSDSISTIYEKRWKVEEYHKSLKSNVDLAKSPSKRVITQSNHVFLSILAFFKLKCLKIKHKLNHFALRMKLLIAANKIAYDELQRLKCA